MSNLRQRLDRLEKQHAGTGKQVVCVLGLHLPAEQQAQRLEAARAEAGPGGEVVEIRGIDPDGEGVR
jgi:hypothetical protein